MHNYAYLCRIMHNLCINYTYLCIIMHNWRYDIALSHCQDNVYIVIGLGSRHGRSQWTTLREFVELTSSWPPARVVGWFEPRLMTPDPLDPRRSKKEEEDPRARRRSAGVFQSGVSFQAVFNLVAQSGVSFEAVLTLECAHIGVRSHWSTLTLEYAHIGVRPRLGNVLNYFKTCHNM